MKTINKLIEDIRADRLLSTDTFLEIDLDNTLNKRDDPSFESNWISSYKEIEKLWKTYEKSYSQKKIIGEISSTVFIKVSSLTGRHEIASYISDDFNLIAKSILLKQGDNFVNEMLKKYRDQLIPH